MRSTTKGESKEHAPVPIPPTAEEIAATLGTIDDFGFELRVGAVLAGVPKLDLQHGGTYDDPALNKPRQFDYRARITGEMRGFPAHLLLAVECKNLSPLAPLVVSGGERDKREAFHCVAHSAKAILNAPKDRVVRTGWSMAGFYAPQEFVGKSLNQIVRKDNQWVPKGDSDIYDRYSQALASATDLVEEAVYLAHQQPHPNSASAVVLPIVVVPNDTLWGAVYGPKGTLREEPKKVAWCSFFVDRAYPWEEFTISHVEFMTLRGLGFFLEHLSYSGAHWPTLFPKY